MKIVCANCGNAKSIDKPRNGQAITCEKCGTPVKVAICPECSAVYSIAFADLKSVRYTMKCRSCAAKFIVDFSAEYQQNKAAPSPVDKKKVSAQQTRSDAVNSIKAAKKKTAENKTSFLKTAAAWFTSTSERSKKNVKKIIPPDELKTTITNRQAPAPVYTQERNSYDLNGYLAECGKFLNVKNFFISASGAVILAIIISAISGIAELLASSGMASETIADASAAAVALFGCAVIESVICRSTAIDDEHSRGSILKLAAYTVKITAGSAVFLTVILAAAAAVTSIAGSIPLVGPVLFSLMFLPVYLAFIALLLISIVGFWFFPAVSSYTQGGYYSVLMNLILFTRRHNYRLIFIIPILSILAMLLSGAVYLLNYYSIKFSLQVFGGFIPAEAAKIFSSIPAGMHRIFNITYMGTDLSKMKVFMQGLLLSHEAAGIVLGFILILISLSMVSVLIITAAALSHNAYKSLEEGLDIDDSAKLRLLGILLLVLGGIYLAKSIFR